MLRLERPPFHKLFSNPITPREQNQPRPTSAISAGSLQSHSSGENNNKQKNNRIQPYLRAANLLHQAEWEENSSKDPFFKLTPTGFWYLISAQYFPESHLPPSKRTAVRLQAAQKVRNYVNSVTLKTRFQRKKCNPYRSIEENAWRTEELREKADSVSVWIQYYFYLEPPKPKIKKDPFRLQPKESVKVQQLSTPTTLLQDFSFINSTATMITNILKQKMKTTEPYSTVVKTYLQNITLKQTRAKVHKSYIQLEDFIDPSQQPHNMNDLQQKKDHNEQFLQFELTQDHILRSIALDLPLDIVIGLLEQTIPDTNFPLIQDEQTEQLWIDQEDTFNFVGTHHAVDDQWIALAKDLNRKKRQISSEEEGGKRSKRQKYVKEEDLPCQICFSGEYEENNMILLCSLCNIAMHQLCVYLKDVPEHNWICPLCEVVGPQGVHMPCPLCPKRGGAMLESPILASDFISHNPQYNGYLSRRPALNQPKYFVTQSMRLEKDTPLLYNYFKQDTYPTEQPNFYKVWAHYSCVSVHNECYFSVQGQAIVAEGIRTIPPQRYGVTCQICKQSFGVAAKCRDEACKRYFHAQCARRLKMVSEQYQKQNVIYKVFCPLHRPFETEQNLLSRRRKAREEIKKVAGKIVRGLGQQKFPYKLPNIEQALRTPKPEKREPQQQPPETPKKKKATLTSKFGPQPQPLQKQLEKTQKSKPDTEVASKQNPTTKKQSKPKQLKAEIIKLQDKTYLSILRCYQPKQPSPSLPPQTQPKPQEKKSSKQSQQPPSKTQTPTDKTKIIKKHSDHQKNKKTKHKRQDKKEINFITENAVAIENSTVSKMRKNLHMEGKSGSLRRGTASEKTAILYCICKQPYDNNREMLQCKECNEWFHFDCIDFKSTIEKADKLDFVCLNCLGQLTKHLRQQHIKSYLKFFNKKAAILNTYPDSLLPTLSSHSKSRKKQQTVTQSKIPNIPPDVNEPPKQKK